MSGSDFEPGREIGDYRLQARIGAGGMSELWMAKDAAGRFVVVKRPVGLLAAKAEGRASFIDEAEVMMCLGHPIIAQALELLEVGGVPALVMEYVSGPTMRRIIDGMEKRGIAMDLRVALTVVAQVCAGLHHAHEAADQLGQPLNLVHRDVTPSNVLLSDTGRVKLVDFGIAMSDKRQTVTAVGYIKGNPHYMSPEQALGAAVDRRTDVYGTGTLLYELVTGRRPFHDLDENDVLVALAQKKRPIPPSIVEPECPPELDALIQQAMAPEAAGRFDSARAMGQAAEQLLPEGPAAPDLLAETVKQLFPRGFKPSAVQAVPRTMTGELPIEFADQGGGGRWWRRRRR